MTQGKGQGSGRARARDSGDGTPDVALDTSGLSTQNRRAVLTQGGKTSVPDRIFPAEHGCQAIFDCISTAACTRGQSKRLKQRRSGHRSIPAERFCSSTSPAEQRAARHAKHEAGSFQGAEQVEPENLRSSRMHSHASSTGTPDTPIGQSPSGVQQESSTGLPPSRSGSKAGGAALTSRPERSPTQRRTQLPRPPRVSRRRPKDHQPLPCPRCRGWS